MTRKRMFCDLLFGIWMKVCNRPIPVFDEDPYANDDLLMTAVAEQVRR